MPDGDKSIIMLKLLRKEKNNNEEFYDNFISIKNQLKKEKEREKYLNSLEEEKKYTYDIGGINFDHQIVNRFKKYKKLKIKNNCEEDKKRKRKKNDEKTKKKKRGSSKIDNDILLSKFNYK